MKKIFAIMLAIVLIFALVSVVACKTDETVYLTIYATPTGTPRVCKHVIGQDDLPTVINGDLEFDGWYKDKNYNESSKFDPINDSIENGAVLYAKWKQGDLPIDEKVTLTLNYNYAGAQPKTEELNKGATYALPTPNQDGYTFNGWFTEAIGGTQWTSTTPVNENTTLYAHWTENTQPIEKVTLTLDPNYSGQQATSATINKGSTYQLQNLTRSGYTFDGWYTQAVGGTQYTSSTVINEDITLYAHWTENTQPIEKVTLTLDPNYSGQQVTSATINKGSTYQLPNLTRSGYTFDGWYTQTNGGTKYTSSTPINSDITLYAHWTENAPQPEQVTLTLNLNYTGAAAPTTATVNKGATYAFTTPTRSGYTFDGWYTQASGGTKYTSSTPINSDITLYAHWTENSQGSTQSVKEQFLTSVVSQPQDGESYYIAMYYKLPDKVYYGVDSVSGKKLYSTEDKAEAAVATIEKTSDGFYIKLGSRYLSLSTSDTVSLTSSASTVFHVGENNILIATYSGVEYTLGSYQSGTSTTLYTYFGVSKASYSTGTNASKVDVTQFPVRLVTLDGLQAPVYPMEDQFYDEDTFDNKNLQDKYEESEDYIGLPSTGTYNALVIPVQFSGDTITQTQLNNLNLAFNGTSTDTGWESVKSFYEKSSYGKLNITFDIMDVYQSSNNANYYKNKSEVVYLDGDPWTKPGSAFILEEVLAYYESRIDLTKYDHNNDGCIDAVYLIYSESVDYDDADFYWAYVTWYYDENQYDGLYPYYYLFAGFDFMDEKVQGKDTHGYTTIPGLKINAETYIHETGHLLGLDDYYDYYENTGSDQGLGGADMMDYNVGDHGVYSKIMLGWLTPEIVTSTKTVTIQSSQEGGYAILIPLNWNNSYFCEYLLIDLYTNTGLNEMGATLTNSILYDGAAYGVRIYHVSSAITNSYNDDYGSFTDNNNSVSNIPLIKLVEADGETSKSTEGSWASESDLWQTGDSLNSVFPNYTRNDGMMLNFNITIDSVSAEEATITITYNASQAA